MPLSWNQRPFTTCLTATTTCCQVQRWQRHQPRLHRSAHAVSARDDVVVGPMLQHSVHAKQPRRRKWPRACSSAFELTRHHTNVPSPSPPSPSPSPSPLSPSSPSPLPPRVTLSPTPLSSPPPPLPPVAAPSPPPSRLLPPTPSPPPQMSPALSLTRSPQPSLSFVAQPTPFESASTRRLHRRLHCFDLPRASLSTFRQLRFKTVRAARLLVLVVHGGRGTGPLIGHVCTTAFMVAAVANGVLVFVATPPPSPSPPRHYHRHRLSRLISTASVRHVIAATAIARLAADATVIPQQTPPAQEVVRAGACARRHQRQSQSVSSLVCLLRAERLRSPIR